MHENWILKDFLKIEKSSKCSSYSHVDHFLRSCMLPKVFTTIPGQDLKQWKAMVINILEISGSSLTPTYKRNTAKNCMKIGFWRIFSKLKKFKTLILHACRSFSTVLYASKSVHYYPKKIPDVMRNYGYPYFGSIDDRRKGSTCL